MKHILAPLLLLSPGIATAQAVQPGAWDVKSTAVDLDIPGAPHFLLRMMRGKSKVEHKCIAPDQAKAGVAAVLAPDPKSKCRTDSLRVEANRFDQVMLCPQKDGATLRLTRVGTYGASSYAARLTMAGQTPKGAMRIVLDQAAARTGAACRK